MRARELGRSTLPASLLNLGTGSFGRMAAGGLYLNGEPAPGISEGLSSESDDFVIFITHSGKVALLL